MACVTVTKDIIPAPLIGNPIVLELTINNQTCKMHINGFVSACFATKYRQSLCCGDENKGFEVPILGYNTTPTVYSECDGGLVPLFGSPRPTTSSLHSTGTARLPEPTQTSGGNKKKIGAIFLGMLIISLM